MLTTSETSTPTESGFNGHISTRGDGPDTRAALDFLASWVERTGLDHITVVAILPDGPTDARTFPSSGLTEAGQWIVGQQRAGWNIYYQPNETPPWCASKPGKADMVAAVCRFADIDPADDQPHEAERVRLPKLADELAASECPPTFIIDSGNGIQPVWVTGREPLPDAAARAELIERIEDQTRKIEAALGAGGTHNIDRLLRVPGTVNFPNAAKRKRGRTVTQARLLHRSDRVYTTADGLPERIGAVAAGSLLVRAKVLSAATSSSAGANTTDAAIAARMVELGDAAPGQLDPTIQARLDAALAAHPILKRRWEGDTTGMDDTSRSGLEFSLAALLQAHFSKDEIGPLLCANPHTKFGQGEGTVRELARSIERASVPADTPHTGPMPEAWKANAAELAAEQQAKIDSIPGPVPFSDLVFINVPPVRELIPGLIERGIVTFLSATGGSHKSRLAVQWGLCLASGVPVFGRPVEPATFVYLSYEDHPDEVTRRTQKIVGRLSLPVDSGNARFWDLTGDGQPLAIVTEAGIEPQPFHDRLCAYLKSIPGHKFIVADSAYNVLQFTGAAKINEASVKAGIEFLGRLCREADSTMLVLWHPSQAGQERGDASGWSVAWHNTPRARLSLTAAKDQEGVYDLKVEKRNNAPKGPPITLRWSDGVLLPRTELDAAEQEARFMDACVNVTKEAARTEQHVKRQKKPFGWVFDEIERRAGRRPSDTELKQTLEMAVRLGRLRYVDSTRHGKAGYAPFDPEPPRNPEPPLGRDQVPEDI